MEARYIGICIALLLSACGGEVADKAFKAYMKRRGCEKVYEICGEVGYSPTPPVTPPVVTIAPSPEPTSPLPLPTATPVPTSVPSPTPSATGDCSLIRFGDGRGGTLFLKSATQKGWKFLTPGKYRKPSKVFFCRKGKCSGPNPDYPACGGWANPDHTSEGKIDRWHSCTPGSADEIRVDDCKPLKVPVKCRRNGRCD